MSEQTVQGQEPPAEGQVPAADPTPTAPAPLTGEPNDPAAMTRAMNASQQEAAQLRAANEQLQTQVNTLMSTPAPAFTPPVATPQPEVDPTMQEIGRTNARLAAMETNNGIANLRTSLGGQLDATTETMIRQQIAHTGVNDPSYHYYALVGKAQLDATAKAAAAEAQQLTAARAAEANATAMPQAGTTASASGGQTGPPEGASPAEIVAWKEGMIQEVMDSKK